jgi:nucleoid-associated protein EbfC
MEPGGFDMQQIFQAAQQMQAQLMNAQQALADTEVTGTAGGGAVRAVVSGQGELLDLTIDPSVIDTSDLAETAATVADLVLAAVRDATRAASELQEEQLGAFGGAGGVDLSAFGGAAGGLDLSALGISGVGPARADDEDEDEEN